MSPATARLLADIDTLPRPARMRFLAERARDLPAHELEPLLTELYAGDRFRREMALYLAVVSGHQPVMAAARNDPVWAIRRTAISAWLRSSPAGDPPAGTEIAAFVAGAPWHDRRHVYRLLRRLSRADIADALVDAVWERFGDTEAARLLPACSAATLARLLPELGYTVGDWRRLAERHPGVVLDVAAAQLAELTIPHRATWWALFGEGVLAAARTAAPRVLGLLELYAPPSHLTGPLRYYASLAAADHVRLLALMTAPGRTHWLAHARLPRPLLRQLAGLDTAQLAPLAQRLRENQGALVTLLRALPPSRRAALYAAAYTGVDRTQARPSDAMLEVLPRDLRTAEARRVLALDTIRADTELTLHYSAFLPWEQAREPLAAAARRGRAEDRAEGYGLLVACAARTADPDIVTEVIEYVQRIRNDQDPVRSHVITALTGISAELLQARAAEPLTRIAADTLAARDTSGQTRQALTVLAVAVLGRRAGVPPLLAWSLSTLQQMFENRLPPLGRLDRELRRGQELEVYAAVRKRLEAGVRRGSYDALFAVVRALGRRAWRMEPLQDMLRRAVHTGNVAGVMRQGIALWLADPATRSERVQRVLRTDSSAVILPEVWLVLCVSRTDLLDRALIGKRPEGKFLAAGVRWVPASAPHAHGWLPRHQAACARLLGTLAGDTGARIHVRTQAISTAARLGDAGWEVITRFAGSNNVSLAEAALAALARTDRPADALPVLLGHSGDDRARVAMYAAGRAARYIRPAQLLPVLTGGDAGAGAGLAAGKVTSRKEALRLIASLHLPGAGDILRQEWVRDGQHRDIRAAIASAARQRLHDPLSWPILAEAVVGGPDEALAVTALARVFACAPRYRPGYARLIAQACRSQDQAVAIAAWAAMPGWLDWAPDATAMISGQITNLEDRVRWQLGLPAVQVMLATGRPSPVLDDITGQLAALDGADGHDPLRDRPARQRLNLVIDRAAEWSRDAEPDLDRAPLADAGRALARQPDMTLPAAWLLLAATQFDEQLVSGLTEVCALVDGQPVTAIRLADSLTERLAADSRADPEIVRAAAARLERDGGLAAGLFAVALTSYGHRFGWPAAWRAQLRQLREHELADVRAAALAVFTVAELQT